jgi:hypothetical protein
MSKKFSDPEFEDFDDNFDDTEFDDADLDLPDDEVYADDLEGDFEELEEEEDDFDVSIRPKGRQSSRYSDDDDWSDY